MAQLMKIPDPVWTNIARELSKMYDSTFVDPRLKTVQAKKKNKMRENSEKRSTGVNENVEVKEEENSNPNRNENEDVEMR